MFACKICKYTTDIKCNYIKHLNTKKHKKRNEQLLENMVPKANMRRHELHRCKVNKEQNLINELKVENSIMTEEHKEEKTNLYKHIEALLEKVGNTYNTTNHNNCDKSPPVAHETTTTTPGFYIDDNDNNNNNNNNYNNNNNNNNKITNGRHN